MPNTFGPPGTGYPLIDTKCVRDHRERFRRDMIVDLDRANSYYSMSGRWPDIGWILLDRESYDKINPYATNLQLKIEDFVNPSLTISNLTVVHAECMTTGLSDDPNAIYLIQLTNSQGVLYNQWFQTPVNAQYNVRAPAYDTQYYSSTLNGGTTIWTWNTMVADLWSKAPNQLGTYPGLPTTPLATPENFIFVGTPLWEAIVRILNYLGMTVAGSYPNLTIVSLDGADSSFATLQSKYSIYLEDDSDYIDGGSGRVPGEVVVYFHRRNQIYGTEETVRRDGYQWQSIPAYTVTVPAPTDFSSAAGTAFIWSSFTVRYDINGIPLPADVTMAALVAAERADQFYRTIFRGTQGFMRQVYSGVLPFTTGSLVDGVRWYNCGHDDGGRYGGWRTEIIRGYVWEEATFRSVLSDITAGPI